ncbi:Cryptic loci regulator [Hyphodiscus hymeniophilus]|uniref:Histone deacetylase n=1 Tax=Hyphodiscus hymeniophilus TaxID=353542 RepID=A0A9P7AW04_9HELO|nr:Cryptic loci regulator [Hyphodiscus hymeniophilus]
MESSLPHGLVETSEIDTVMHDNESANDESHLQNGFVDPRVLDQMEDMEPSTSTQDSEQAETEEEEEPKPSPRRFDLPTGCCYDARMKMHANADFSQSPHHPEDPRRIEAIFQEFRRAGLIYDGSDIELAEKLKRSPTSWMWRISAREATMAEVCTAHTASHYEWVHSLNVKSSAELRAMTTEMDNGRKSLYVGNLTYDAALISAGGAIETCKNVVAGKVKNAIAVIRPPGHHAEHNESMGFCIFNNVPIAAKVCMADYPEVCRKVLILDWDVHHGNGIQNIFYDDPNVLYISIHVYQNGAFYPGAPEHEDIPDGGLGNCGVGLGMGRNVNIGWHDQGMGDGEYMAAFQKIVMPIAQEFDPDLVIISAGFDAAAGDELGGCYVTPECYSHMTHMLMSLANGKVAVCLEGGYNLRAISRSALAVAKTLMGEPPVRMQIPPINKTSKYVLDQVKSCQAPFWNCMRDGLVAVEEMDTIGSRRLHDELRYAQAARLIKEHKMTTLFIRRDKLSVSFENQVLATSEIYSAKRILVVIHDSPELLVNPDPVSGKIHSHNAITADPVLPYIDWAVANGFGVIDINFPSYKTNTDDTPGFKDKLTEVELQNQTKDLLCYLWDNYLEGFESQGIVLMGVGDAYLGVKQLLTFRDCKLKIPCIVSFVSGSLRPVKSETDPSLSSWYKAHSRIYVSPDHACWNDEESARKVKKQRFGGVKMAEVTGLNAMMRRHLKDAGEYILDMVGDVTGDETEEDSDELVREGPVLGNGNGRRNGGDLGHSSPWSWSLEFMA